MVGRKVGGLVLIVAPDPFYLRSPVLVAPDLIGCFVAHAGVTVEIVETEAYLGADDAASHARSGPTVRCRSMYGPVGTAYIYKSYGVHLCLNVVCHGPETGGAVLLRAGTVVSGETRARQRRGGSKGLADGPGKLAQCLALAPELDGTCLQNGSIHLERVTPLASREIQSGPRIGISKNVDVAYRFWLTGCPDVSKGGSRR
jgi:DNA-3-methyladenine glycosylase